MNYIMTQINRFRTWWTNNHAVIEQNVANGFRTFGRGINRIANNVTRLIIIGVIVNVIASYFYPEFPERFPVIYGWFDGWLQFGEFLLKIGLTCIYSFFTGNWSEFWTEYNGALGELMQQFVNWLGTLHF